MYELKNKKILMFLICFALNASSIDASGLVKIEQSKKSLFKRFISTACSVARGLAGMKVTPIGVKHFRSGLTTMMLGRALMPCGASTYKLRGIPPALGIVLLLTGGYCFKKGWDWINDECDLKKDLPKLFIMIIGIPTLLFYDTAFLLQKVCKDDLNTVYRDPLFEL